MSSRKRKNSPDPGTETTLSKRARLLSNLWQTQEETVGTTQGSQSNPSSPVYRIKAIIGERPTEYLIDWADDPITGETFKPDWQPKKNANTAAVKAWDQKNLSNYPSTSDRSRRQRGRRRRLGANRDRTTSDIAVETGRPQPQRISETPSHKTNTEQNPSLSTFNQTNIFVRVSQHSSFDRDLYIAYQSSLSTQGNPSSLLPDRNSGIEKSSPPATTSPVGSNGIIPDSQSLPGSSSYEPTSSTSLAVLGADQAPPTHQSPFLNNSTDLEASTGRLAEAHDSIEDSSAVVIAASQPSVIASERSRSEPAPKTTESSSVSPFARFPSLPRSTSDPTPTFHDRHRRRAFVSEHPGGHHTIQDQVIQSSADFQSLHQTRAGYTQQRQIPSEVQVPGSADRSSHEGHTVDDSPSHSLVFQTQVPLAFASQGSRVSITSAEDQLPNAQPNSQFVEDISEISSGSIGRPAHRIDPKPSNSTAISETKEYRSRHCSAASETFVISEDSTHNSNPSQATTTDDSILSLRDPNSQSTRQNHPGPSKEDVTHLGNFKGDSTTRTSSSSILANQVQLPDTLDSREPPLPPSSSEDGMSDMASNDKEGMQPLRIRATLKRIREDGEAKRVAARSGKRQHSESSTPRASPSLARDDREGSQMTAAVEPSSLVPEQQEQSHPSAAEVSPARCRDEQPGPPRSTARPSSSMTKDELQVRVQSPVAAQSSRSTASPSSIPVKAPYQVQEEPERLEVQPSMILKEFSLPARNPQSAPHTPTTPSKLSMHKEAYSLQSQTTTLKARNLGPREFVITLPMQPRILSQYVDTIEFYPQAIRRNMTEEKIGEDIVENLNTLLYRLGNVATHIGLEGGGPSSQEEVNPEEEALYAELSSEKFKFLGQLLALTKERRIHIAVIAKPGHLLDIIEMFLKGKNVSYLRPDTKTNGLKPQDPDSFGLQVVSIIPSGEAISLPPVQLIIAFDETFDAKDAHIVKWRENRASDEQLTPVIRLVVYSSVEHLDLCLARSLEPIDRIRKLIFCVWHTQRSVGQLEPDEPSPSACAQEVFKFFDSGSNTSAWTLANIRPIENLPLMDSDSSLSDAISDISDIYKPEGAPRYYPNPVLPLITNPKNPDALPRARRPFDLEHGDSLQVQAKKRKVLADYNAGRLNSPPTIESLTAEIQECKLTEKLCADEKRQMTETIKSHECWHERRQYDYEEMRQKAGDRYATIQEQAAELEKAKKDNGKARTEILALKGERGTLQKELTTARLDLLNHPDPAVRETAIKDARIRELEADVLAKNKKIDNQTKDWDLTKRLWTDASTAATTATQELAALEAKQPELVRKAAENETKRKELKNDAMIKALQKEVFIQRATVKSRDNLIRRKEEQIAELKRGRGGVQTRGSSVQPRSPRGGSRGASPAAGMFGGGGKGASGLSSRLNLDG